MGAHSAEKRSGLDVSARLRTGVGRRRHDPALALARVLPFAAITRALAGALTFAAVAGDTFDPRATAVVGQHQGLRHEHQANRRCEDRACEFDLVHPFLLSPVKVKALTPRFYPRVGAHAKIAETADQWPITRPREFTAIFLLPTERSSLPTHQLRPIDFSS
jgi:hypothetical protein